MVLIADGTVDQDNDSISIENVSFKNPVPVIKDFDISKPIGVAALSVDGNTVKAKITIPDSLDPTGEAFWYIPAIGGSCDRVKPDGNKIRTITNLKIYKISLSMKPNSDPRIKPIGDRVDE